MDPITIATILGAAAILILAVVIIIAWRYYTNEDTDIPPHGYSQHNNRPLQQQGYGAHTSGGILFEGHRRNVPIDPDRYYTEEEAADKAIEAKGLTILRSDFGRLWKSSMDGRIHAEDKFLDDGPRNVKTIWLKNSPCLECAKRLNKECRPMHVCVGHIYREQDGDREKSRKKEIGMMKKNGFTFSAWKVYCRKAGIDVMRTNHDIIYNM